MLLWLYSYGALDNEGDYEVPPLYKSFETHSDQSY